MIATATKERPILFSAPMVRAILEGRKTQTRRVVKPQPHSNHLGYMAVDGGALLNGPDYPDGDDDFVKCPYGKPGDRLWVRESCLLCTGIGEKPEKGKAKYACFRDGSQKLRSGQYFPWNEPVTGDWPSWAKWTPSIHMPRWASRIDLEITSVRFERLQDINEADAFHEGAERPECGPFELHGVPVHPMTGSYQEGFKKLWQSINGPDSWAANPWVWVVEFQRIGGAK